MQRSDVSLDRDRSSAIPKQVVTSQNYDDKIVPTLNKNKEPDVFIEEVRYNEALFISSRTVYDSIWSLGNVHLVLLISRTLYGILYTYCVIQNTDHLTAVGHRVA